MTADCTNSQLSRSLLFAGVLDTIRLYFLQTIEYVRGLKMTTQTFTAMIHKEDDLYVAQCPEVGTVSQGYSLEEALSNLQEATELYLEEFPVSQFAKPFLTTFEARIHA